jgi:hypothetical protein
MSIRHFSAHVLTLAVAIATALATHPDVRADLVYYSDQSTFESQGNILSRANLDSYGTGEAIIGYGTVLGGVVVQDSPYLISLGTANGIYPTVQNVAVSPEFSSVDFAVQSNPTQYNLLGFLLGTVLGSSDAQISVTTNVTTYYFTVGTPWTGSSLAFEGFATTSSSEYITGFSAYAAPANGGGAAVTGFELGTSPSALAPEPGSLAVVALVSLFWLGGRALRREVSSARGFPRIR